MDDHDGKISPLLRMIAHDLKGLLGTPGILIHLAESSKDGELRSYLTSLRESFRAIDRAVTDIGDLGAAVGTTTHPNPQRTDVRELLVSALALARDAGIQRKIELEGELAPGPWPPVTGDPQTIGRSLERLVFWGITHARSGARVVIACDVFEQSIRLRVPGGTGALAVVPTVQERLREIEAGNRELGVALPLVREALERHGGSLVIGPDGTIEARIPISDQIPL
jgi:K+-sensing histidine kinase KdpD